MELTPREIWDEIRVIPLAKHLGLSKEGVYKWKKANRIPAERVPEVESYTKIHRWRLRPDLWDAPSD